MIATSSTQRTASHVAAGLLSFFLRLLCAPADGSLCRYCALSVTLLWGRYDCGFIFEHLWRVRKKSGSAEIWIPETIIFKNNSPTHWYFTRPLDGRFVLIPSVCSSL
jgi:hypothetical protein